MIAMTEEEGNGAESGSNELLDPCYAYLRG